MKKSRTERVHQHRLFSELGCYQSPHSSCSVLQLVLPDLLKLVATPLQIGVADGILFAPGSMERIIVPTPQTAMPVAALHFDHAVGRRQVEIDVEVSDDFLSFVAHLLFIQQEGHKVLNRTPVELPTVGALSPGGSAGNHRLPFVAGIDRAAPPDFPAGTGNHLAGRGRFVPRRMPFAGKLRVQERQGSGGGHHQMGAHGAAGTVDAVGDDRLPLVTAIDRAVPPHARVAPGHHFAGPQVAVFRGMPFFSEGGVKGTERGCRRDCSSRADGASLALNAVFDNGTPDVGGLPAALPPHFPVAARSHGVGGSGSVLLAVPLFSQERVQRL